MEHYLLPALVTLLIMLLMFALAWRVGGAREKYKVVAPSCVGDPVFERHFRVQMNTMENVILFLPTMWMAALYWNATYAAILGGVWLIGRIWYAQAYVGNPKGRGISFVISVISWGVALVGATWGIISKLMA